ncbi:zinc finger, SWIM-type [Artemisia annua]|uniref:Zinc finger, SWIM-type n=1 Tax=Artemisia annua TaxID=35608 RepID=A0A2U1PTD1_ARTAN|nr:zinc finger, SWIM-type [Artemisia annua]
MYSMAQDVREVGMTEDWVHEAYWLNTWKVTYNHKIIPVANSHFWPKCTIPSILLPPHHHVPVGRPRKKRTKSKEETTEKALKEMIKGGKLSKKGKTVTCGQCGTKGHNKRACIGPRNKTAKGKGNKNARAEGVADSEATETYAGPSQPMDSQSTQEVGSQRRKSIKKGSKQAAIRMGLCMSEIKNLFNFYCCL